jgi:hypothetical protein
MNVIHGRTSMDRLTSLVRRLPIVEAFQMVL